MLARNIGVQGDLALQDTLAAIKIYCGGSLSQAWHVESGITASLRVMLKNCVFIYLEKKNDIQADGVYLVKGC